MAALLHGGHGVGRCHREYSGYDGPWTGQENTFSNFYSTLLDLNRAKVNESLPAIHSWQLTSASEVNGVTVMELPSDLTMVGGFLDFAHSPAPGVPGPAADATYLQFVVPGMAAKQLFMDYFADVYARLLEVNLEGGMLGGYVSTDAADPWGLEADAVA
ncbi:hypothetical protein HDU98_005523 [Podochytrium sp. JEL0797]|nr:hypothetical protein HDU98_005523 [Podochytrium sp. JEL0797]